jgi:hypothetical protein
MGQTTPAVTPGNVKLSPNALNCAFFQNWAGTIGRITWDLHPRGDMNKQKKCNKGLDGDR